MSGAAPGVQPAFSRTTERLLRALGMPRPLPAVKVDLRSTVPAWLLRLLQLAIVLGCVAVLAFEPFHWGIGVLFAGVMIVRPAPVWSVLFVVWMGAFLLFLPGDPLAPRVFLLLFGTHLLLALSAVLDRAALMARVERVVLVRPLRRFLLVQAFSQALAVGAGWLATREVSAVWVAVLAVVLLAAVMWTVSVRLARRTRAADD